MGILDAEQQSMSCSATASALWLARGTLRVFRNSMALRRDSLGAKLRCYATLERSEGRYVLADLGIRHGVYAAIPSELTPKQQG
jgi:hypothetical protein